MASSCCRVISRRTRPSAEPKQVLQVVVRDATRRRLIKNPRLPRQLAQRGPRAPGCERGVGASASAARQRRSMEGLGRHPAQVTRPSKLRNLGRTIVRPTEYALSGRTAVSGPKERLADEDEGDKTTQTTPSPSFDTAGVRPVPAEPAALGIVSYPVRQCAMVQMNHSRERTPLRTQISSRAASRPISESVRLVSQQKRRAATIEPYAPMFRRFGTEYKDCIIQFTN